MPNNLEEFKEWLEAEPIRKKDLPNWDDFFSRTERANVSLKLFFLAAKASSLGDIFHQNYQIALRWEKALNGIYDAQDWINEKFPTLTSKQNVRQLIIKPISDPAGGIIDPIINEGMGRYQFFLFLEGKLDLKDFTNLINLSITGSPQRTKILTEINLVSCRGLKSLWLENLGLKSLVLGEHPNLISFDVKGNDLFSINFAGCPSLKLFGVHGDPNVRLAFDKFLIIKKEKLLEAERANSQALQNRLTALQAELTQQEEANQQTLNTRLDNLVKD